MQTYRFYIPVKGKEVLLCQNRVLYYVALNACFLMSINIHFRWCVPLVSRGFVTWLLR